MKKQFIYFLFLFLCILNTYSININVTGIITEEPLTYSEKIFVQLNCSETLNLSFPSGVKKIQFENGTLINSPYIYLNGCNNLSNEFTYNYDKLELLSKDNYRLERKFSQIANLSQNYRLVTPINFAINQTQSNPSQFSTQYSDTSKTITFPSSAIYVLYLQKLELEEENPYSFIGFKEELSESSVLLLIVISFSLGAGLVLLYFLKIKKDQHINTTVPSYVLSVEERKILEILKTNPGINQKMIGKHLDFSKARVSAIVNDLEQKQLIKREKFGRSFKVFLNKKIV